MKNSPQAKADFEILLNNAIPFIEFLLQKNKEFFPFAYLMETDGELLKLDSGIDDEHPTNQEVIDSLKIQIRRAKQLKAVAIAYMTFNSSENSDFITIEFSHVNGGGLLFVLPYAFKGITKRLELGSPTFGNPHSVIDLK
ncbi:MAG TPA: hypothetical protein VIM31_04460 [Candidatus Microsaccharimonas sp.]|jgi:hypothetical protein